MYKAIVNSIQYREGMRKAAALPKSLAQCQDMPVLDEDLHSAHPPFGGRPEATWSFNWVEDTREHQAVAPRLT